MNCSIRIKIFKLKNLSKDIDIKSLPSPYMLFFPAGVYFPSLSWNLAFVNEKRR